MKNIFKTFTLIAVSLPLVFLQGCSKEYGPDKIPNFPKMDVAPVPKFTVDASADLVIQQPENFKGKFTLDLYFPEDARTLPKSADISVAKNRDYTNIKKLKSGITSFPVTIEITGADLASLFGIEVADIVPGNRFEIRADFTMEDGTVIPGFVDLNNGETANTASSDINGWPDSKTNVVYNAVCPLEIEAFLGDKTVDDPFFWEGSYPVTVTLEGEDVLVVTGINETPGVSMKIKIDFKSFIATVTKRVLDPAPWFFSYTNLYAEGSGNVDACNGVITMDLKWGVDQGGFGNGTFILKP
ncbi:MAG: hypothetical protein M9933_04310 [Chitinophagaceae bacterium]|nr:hypothetical protein [Chitinophagaceae bacterium]